MNTHKSEILPVYEGRFLNTGEHVNILTSAYLFSITSTASHETFWPMNTWITLKRKVKEKIIYMI